MDLRKKKIPAVLVFLIKEGKVLLGRKSKTSKVGAGLWNGWGGGINREETSRQAAKRELFEESGLSVRPRDLKYAGNVVFHNQKADGGKFDVKVYIFTTQKWSGKLKLNSEMTEPTFWPISRLPFGEMMPSDRFWFLPVLSGKRIRGEVWHGLNQKILARPVSIKVVK